VTTSDWLVVAVAGSLASGVVGVVLTLPAWAPGHRSTLLVGRLLGLHAGLVAVGGAAMTAAAIRSWQLVDEEPAEQASATLIEVSGLDGDGRLYALIVLLVVATTACSVLMLTVAARFALSDDVLPRTLACAVLGLEIGLCGFGLAQVLAGSRNAVAIGAVVNLPLVMAAMVACWPPHPDRPSRPRRAPIAAPDR